MLLLIYFFHGYQLSWMKLSYIMHRIFLLLLEVYIRSGHLNKITCPQWPLAFLDFTSPYTYSTCEILLIKSLQILYIVLQLLPRTGLNITIQVSTFKLHEECQTIRKTTKCVVHFYMSNAQIYESKWPVDMLTVTDIQLYNHLKDHNKIKVKYTL